MKILYTNFHEGYGGGQTTYITTLAAHLSKKHQISIATPLNSDLYRVAQETGANVVPIKFKTKFFALTEKLANLKFLRNLIQHEQFDVIHVNGSADHKLVRLALCSLRNKPKVVFTKHNSFGLKTSSKNRLKNATNTIICVSEYTKQQLVNEGISTEKLKVIYNGVDILHYQPANKTTRQEIRQQFNLNDNDFVLGSVAGNAPYKGWHHLTQALTILKSTPFKVILAGDAVSDEMYNKHIKANHLENTVIFPGKYSDVRDIIPAFDVGFVLSDSVETISFACREMMAMGVPTMVSDYAGLPENITDNKDGWIIPKATSQSLVSFLPKLASMDLTSFKNAARKKAIQAFGVNRFVDQTEACYF